MMLVPGQRREQLLHRRRLHGQTAGFRAVRRDRSRSAGCRRPADWPPGPSQATPQSSVERSQSGCGRSRWHRAWHRDLGGRRRAGGARNAAGRGRRATGARPISASIRSTASMLVAIPVLCFSLGALAGPWLRARLGEERAIFGVAASLLVGMTLRALWPAWALLPGTILAGLSIAVLNVLLPSLVKRRFPNRIGAMMATYTVGNGVWLVAGGRPDLPRCSGRLAARSTSRSASGPCRLRGAWSPGCHSSGRPSWERHRTAARWRHRRIGARRRLVRIWRIRSPGMCCSSWVCNRCCSTDRSPGCRRSTEIVASIRPTPASCCCCYNGLGIVGNLIAPVIAARLPDQRPAVGAALIMTTIGLLGLLLGADLDGAGLGDCPRDRPGRHAEPGVAGDRAALGGRRYGCRPLRHGSVRRLPAGRARAAGDGAAALGDGRLDDPAAVPAGASPS